MRIFLTGATGFVGSAILSELQLGGHKVLALVRSERAVTDVLARGAEALRGDLRDPGSLREGARSCDAVIHAGFDHDFSRFAESCEMDRAAIESFGSALQGTDKRLLVTSGLPVIAGRAATERDGLPPGAGGMPRVSERTAMAFRERGVHVSVIRMSQVHDGRKQGFASYLMTHARDVSLSAYVDAGHNRWPAIHRRDAARLYAAALERGVSGACYHAVAETGIPMRRIARAIGERLDLPVKSIPSGAASDHFGWLARIAQMDAPASSDWTQRELDWHPREPVGFIANVSGTTPG